MSAFVVDNEVVDFIVTYMKSGERKHYLERLFTEIGYDPVAQPDILGANLMAMNREAVMQRYPDCRDTPDHLPGPIDPEPYHYHYRLAHNKMEVFKHAQCLRYQCSEGTVPDDPLYIALDKFCQTLAERIVMDMPQYEFARWGN